MSVAVLPPTDVGSSQKGFFKKLFSSAKEYVKDCHLIGIRDEALVLENKKVSQSSFQLKKKKFSAQHSAFPSSCSPFQKSFQVPLADTKSVSLYSSSKKKKISEKKKLKVKKSNEEYII